MSQQEPAYVKDVLGQAWRNSQILKTKFDDLKLSFILMAIAVLPWTISLADRVMGIFIGNSKNTTGAKTALQINWAVSKIVNPGLKAQYGTDAYQMKHVIGVDTSTLFACRIGVRNDNDIVWVGRAANYAAKLTTINEYPVYITGTVFDSMDDGSKFGGNPQQLMWEERTWTSMNKMRVFRSSWIWEV